MRTTISPQRLYFSLLFLPCSARISCPQCMAHILISSRSNRLTFPSRAISTQALNAADAWELDRIDVGGAQRLKGSLTECMICVYSYHLVATPGIVYSLYARSALIPGPRGLVCPPNSTFQRRPVAGAPMRRPSSPLLPPPQTTRSWTGGMGLPLMARAREDGLGIAESADTYHIQYIRRIKCIS